MNVSLERLYLTLTHSLFQPKGEKLEMQLLRGLEALTWSEARPL